MFTRTTCTCMCRTRCALKFVDNFHTCIDPACYITAIVWQLQSDWMSCLPENLIMYMYSCTCMYMCTHVKCIYMCMFLCFPTVPRGKRQWKAYHAVLKGFMLYFTAVSEITVPWI